MTEGWGARGEGCVLGGRVGKARRSRDPAASRRAGDHSRPSDERERTEP